MNGMSEQLRCMQALLPSFISDSRAAPLGVDADMPPTELPAHPPVALLGLDKVMITVSSGSSAESLMILAIVMVLVVAPAAIVMVPLTNE